jgi:hypothetical protein
VNTVPDPLLRKSDSTGNRIRDLWICSQELCPLDHRGGRTCTTKTITRLQENPLKICPLRNRNSMWHNPCMQKKGDEKEEDEEKKGKK